MTRSGRPSLRLASSGKRLHLDTDDALFAILLAAGALDEPVPKERQRPVDQARREESGVVLRDLGGKDCVDCIDQVGESESLHFAA